MKSLHNTLRLPGARRCVQVRVADDPGGGREGDVGGMVELPKEFLLGDRVDVLLCEQGCNVKLIPKNSIPSG